MRVLIAGLGGIGGVMAGELVRAGHEPVLLSGNPDIARAIEADGLRYTTPAGSWTVSTRAWPTAADLPDGTRVDAALLAMKATRVLEAARDVAPLLADDGFVVTLQNGLVEDAVAEVVGAERIVSGIIGWGGTLHAPGVVERTSAGATHLGELDGSDTPRLRELSALLEPTGEIVTTANIRGALWSKLAINACITTLGAVTGQTLGEMLADRRARRLFLAVYAEVVDTATALGITLERVAADPYLLYLPRDAGWLTRVRKDLLARVVGLKYRRLRSSSLQSLERGRPTEVEFLNGHVVARAAEVGVPTPLNAALTAMVHELESGEREIHPRNLGPLVALLDASG